MIQRIRGIPAGINILICCSLVFVSGCSSLRLTRERRDGDWAVDQIERVMKPLTDRGARWGLAVFDGLSGEQLSFHRGDELFIPASNIKMIVSAAALERLGTDYQFETRLELHGIRGAEGEVIGDLVIVGGGDPSFCSPHSSDNPISVLEQWCDSLKDNDVSRIVGRVLGCAEFFPQSKPGPGWGWDDLGFGFSAVPSALCFHDNEVKVTVTPAESPGDLASISVWPEEGAECVFSTIRTVEPSIRKQLRLEQPPGESRIILTGVLPVGHEPKTLGVRYDNPALLAARTFYSVLNRENIEVTGVAENGCRHNGNKIHIASHYSASLDSIITVINTDSENLWSEQLLLHIGHVHSGEGDRKHGLAAVREILTDIGMTETGLALYDGSGLSRMNKASPRFLARLLLTASRKAWGNSFERSLAVSGQSGTLSDRMLNTPAEGRIHAKTGSMTGIRTCSGYAMTLTGERIVFSIMVNGYDGSGRAIDSVIDECCSIIVHLEL